MGARGNEGWACDAVVRLLELRSGHGRSDLCYPEKDGNGPPVELRLRLGHDEYALEHTLIEPFENEIWSGITFEQITTHVAESIPSLPGLAYYQLVVPYDVRLPRSDERDGALQHLLDWIVKSAEAMHAENPGRGELRRSSYRWDARVREKLPHFRCAFELLRWPDAARMGRRPGSLYPVRACPDELEELRQRRLDRAFSKKCRKLQQCSADGARTVLVLESDDIALTNFHLVGEQIATVSAARRNAADDIFFVETAIDPWLVWLMKQDGDLWPRVPTRETPQSYEDVRNLEGLTGADVGRWNPTSFRKNKLIDLTSCVGP